MKVVDTLPDFPRKIALKGLQLEAYQLLESADKQKPVIQVALDGQKVPVVKRAFAAAAKALGGSVETRNGDQGTILVKWIPGGAASSVREALGSRARRAHSDEAVEAEARRLWALKGGDSTSYDSQSADSKRKLRISAKRNLSRKGNS